MPNPAATIVELQVDTRAPLVALDVWVEDESARAGLAPFELQLNFNEDVNLLVPWPTVLLSDSPDISIEATSVSGMVVTFTARWMGDTTQATVVTVTVNSTLISDLAGNTLQPPELLTLLFSPSCLEEPAIAADQTRWLRQPRQCMVQPSASQDRTALYFALPLAIVVLCIIIVLATLRYRSLHKPAFDFRALMEEVRQQHLAHLFGTSELGSGASQSSMESQLPALKVCIGPVVLRLLCHHECLRRHH